MTDNEKAIKHFESLQKRYTTQHNGKQCEYVKTALEAMKKQVNDVTDYYCPNCGADMRGGE